jgi:hypothetical protein
MNRRTLWILGALALAGAACDGSGSSTDTLNGGANGAGGTSGAPLAPGVFNTSNNPGPGGTPSTGASSSGSGSSSGSSGSGGAVDAGNPNLDDRVVNYGEALRTASMKLIGVFPLLADIQAIEAASTPAEAQTLYNAKITAMLADRVVEEHLQDRSAHRRGRGRRAPEGLAQFRYGRHVRSVGRRRRAAVRQHPHRGDRDVPHVRRGLRHLHAGELQQQRADRGHPD